MNKITPVISLYETLIAFLLVILVLLAIAVWTLRKRHKPAFAAFFATAALALVIFGVGSASPKNAMFGRFIWHGPRQVKAVALTFDDGPDPAYTPEVLDILDKYQAKATFFMLGESARRYPLLAGRVAEAGHAVGSHCYQHFSLLLASPKRIRSQIIDAELALEEATGQRPRLLRAPYGFHPPFLVREAKRRGYLVAGWSISPHDSFQLPGDVLARRVLDRVKPGDIVLLHDGRENRQETIEALPIILEGLQRKGLRCVTLPQLLAASPIGARYNLNDPPTRDRRFARLRRSLGDKTPGAVR